ncbi:class I SAM-dependent rRNA methyltransferase [Amycolatopsis sp. NBC_01488]|uniref:hypothetical protein n=1 Tax=Amycolatopsis sp. NBC_01488 TaxID=2903563 RepID=UPI002E293D8E|nr:hypothetical protein [Amycolatopsis sp. NBC_01488]
MTTDVDTHFAPAFADVTRRTLWTRPGPGGWNRGHLIVGDIDTEVTRLRAAGIAFRSEVISGRRTPVEPCQPRT